MRLISYLQIKLGLIRLDYREFVIIPTEGEFRGFVHKGELNAVSQYFADSYFPSLASNKDQILARIKSYYEEFKKVALPKLKFDSFSIDFAVTKSEVKVVELNPFSRTTGSCLFDWSKDKEIIENGPLEIRVVEKPLASAEAVISPWSHLISEALDQAQLPLTNAKGEVEQYEKWMITTAAIVAAIAVGLAFLSYSRSF